LYRKDRFKTRVQAENDLYENLGIVMMRISQDIKKAKLKSQRQSSLMVSFILLSDKVEREKEIHGK
jgi:hypothetical protein